MGEEKCSTTPMTMIKKSNMRSNCDRLIPKRGQVKANIAKGLANSVASILSPSNQCSPPPKQAL
ncbi:hypothetical protein RND81_06G116500 [Saponaria officinalis]|uniref:Uncharacterized protein n=1 Tax=Saponaria officinalis TaxID=3572 RepID=A0AAW1K9G1_SAPOF